MPKFLSAVVPAVALGLAVVACHFSAPRPAGQNSQAAPAPPVATPTPVVTTPIATATPVIATASPVVVTLVATATAPPAPSATPIRTPIPAATAEPLAVREVVPGGARIAEPAAQASRATPVAQPTRGAEPASAAPVLPVPTARSGANLYLVKPGDTLSSIAGRYRVTVEAIALANGLDDRDFIRAGQSLRLP